MEYAQPYNSWIPVGKQVKEVLKVCNTFDWLEGHFTNRMSKEGNEMWQLCVAAGKIGRWTVYKVKFIR